MSNNVPAFRQGRTRRTQHETNRAAFVRRMLRVSPGCAWPSYEGRMTASDTPAKLAFRILLALIMVSAGVLHFVRPGGFVKIVPAFLPAPYVLVLVSGAFEILGGVGLLVPFARQIAALGLIALFVAVFPANNNMAMNDIQPKGAHLPTFVLWLRLPVQVVLVAWAWWLRY